jgi:serine/threonine protein kinase
MIGKGSFGSVYLVSRRRDQAQFVLKNMQIKSVPEKEIEVRRRPVDCRMVDKHAREPSAAAAADSMCVLLPASVLLSPLLISCSLAQSYQNEVRLLTELEHPGIVSHVESFIDGDKQHMCIVMGYCEGGDLGAYLKHKKGIPMREGEVLYHFVQMALSLHYMHEKNILHRSVAPAESMWRLLVPRDVLRSVSLILSCPRVSVFLLLLHRDLKVQNIFIKSGLIQLGDFGISKALTGSNDFAQTCIGTPYVRLRHTRDTSVYTAR